MYQQKPKHSYLYYAILTLLILVAFVWCVATVTVSWFEDETTTSNDPDSSVLIVGTLDLDIVTNFSFRNLALAPDTVYTTDKDGKDIGTYLRTSQKHNIDGAYVRVKFTTDTKEISLYFDGNIDKWVYNNKDGYYYYIGCLDDNLIQFNAGYYVSNTLVNEGSGDAGKYIEGGVANAEANDPVTITLKFESIQRQYGAPADLWWEDAPTEFKNFVDSDKNVKHNQTD